MGAVRGGMSQKLQIPEDRGRFLAQRHVGTGKSEGDGNHDCARRAAARAGQTSQTNDRCMSSATINQAASEPLITPNTAVATPITRYSMP